MSNLFKLEFLKGRRTQISAVILASLTLALNLHWITVEQYTQIMGFVTAVGLVTASVHQPKP